MWHIVTKIEGLNEYGYSMFSRLHLQRGYLPSGPLTQQWICSRAHWSQRKTLSELWTRPSVGKPKRTNSLFASAKGSLTRSRLGFSGWSRVRETQDWMHIRTNFYFTPGQGDPPDGSWGSKDGTIWGKTMLNAGRLNGLGGRGHFRWMVQYTGRAGLWKPLRPSSWLIILENSLISFLCVPL